MSLFLPGDTLIALKRIADVRARRTPRPSESEEAALREEVRSYAVEVVDSIIAADPSLAFPPATSPAEPGWMFLRDVASALGVDDGGPPSPSALLHEIQKVVASERAKRAALLDVSRALCGRVSEGELGGRRG